MFRGHDSPLFGDFLRPDDPVYTEIPDVETMKHHVDATLNEYNVEAGILPMDLVLFKDALEHISRIHRVIRQPRGNVLLVGMGGSGRRSLTKVRDPANEFLGWL